MTKLENTSLEKIDFTKFIDIIPDAIVIVDESGTIKYINNQTEELFGFSKQDLIGKTVEELIPYRSREKHTEERSKYSRNPKKRQMGSSLDLFGRKRDGSEFPVDIMLSPLETQEGPLVISVIRNITERKNIEVGLKKQTRQLEDLLSTLTHDLKTPLIAAETSFKHLMEGYFGNLTESQKQILQLLIQNNTSALRLVKNLLSVFQYETKTYKLLLEEIDVTELLQNAQNTVKPFLVQKKLTLNIPKNNFKFVCDPFEIERVITNLLSNSIKFTQNGGSIDISTIKDENGKVIISVKDTGCGIKEEDLQNIFERFWYSRKPSPDSNSTGLGLYLCRQIIENHGGKIWAESQSGKGTKVTFEIPAISSS